MMFALAVWLAASVSAVAQSPQSFPCFKHHGRLVSYSSGSPSLRIWLIGTKRVVGLEDSTIPSVIEPYLDATSPEYSFIYGDFQLCPVEPEKPGHMRRVRMVGAANLVVANAQGLQGPPFRLLSTWQAIGGAAKGDTKKTPWTPRSNSPLYLTFAPGDATRLDAPTRRPAVGEAIHQVAPLRRPPQDRTHHGKGCGPVEPSAPCCAEIGGFGYD